MDTRKENLPDEADEQNQSHGQAFVLTKSYRPDKPYDKAAYEYPAIETKALPESFVRNMRTTKEILYFEPYSPIWFFRPSSLSMQTKVCNYLNHILNKSLVEQAINPTDLHFFQGGWGNEFIIGPEAKKPSASESDKNRYYHLSFIDDDIDEDPGFCLRGVKNGILQINQEGQLSILDKNFNSMKVNSSFIFEDGELKLHSNDWLELERRKKLKEAKSWCNII